MKEEERKKSLPHVMKKEDMEVVAILSCLKDSDRGMETTIMMKLDGIDCNWGE